MPEFNPPSFLQPRQYPDVPKSLDSIFNQAIQNILLSKQLKHQQVESERNLGAMRLQGLASGIDLEALGQAQPQEISGAFQTPTAGVKLSSLQSQIQDFANRKKAMESLGMRKETAETSKLESQAEKESAYGQMLRGIGGTTRQPNIITDPSTGLQFLSQPSMTGPKFTELKGQQLSPEGAKGIATVGSGLRQIKVIRDIVNSPEGGMAILKVGGVGATALALGDTTAQNLQTALKEASDVVARLRTGAQINETEMKHYGSLLTNRYRTKEANLNALDVVETFFKQLEHDLSTGKRIAGQVENIQPIILQLKQSQQPGQQQKKPVSPNSEDFSNISNEELLKGLQ